MKEQLKEQLKTALNKHKEIEIKFHFKLENNHFVDFILFFNKKPLEIGDFSTTRIENHKNPDLMTYLNHEKILGNDTESVYWMTYDGDTIAVNNIRMDLPRDHFYGKESAKQLSIDDLFKTIFSSGPRRLWIK